MTAAIAVYSVVAVFPLKYTTADENLVRTYSIIMMSV